MLTIVDGGTASRRRRQRPLVLLAATVLLSACGGGAGGGGAAKSPSSAGAQPPSTATQRPEAPAHSQQVLDDGVKADAPGCSAAVGSQGKVVWTGVRGVADTATGEPISTDTVFDIGSVSKQFTATATLLLVGSGKLTLDDRLSKYLPELPEWASTVTLTQLMHQTSGIPEYEGLLQSRGYQINDQTTQSQALQAVGAVSALNFKPGSQFAYSGSNYLLLGEVVRRVSGVPLAQFLSAQIFGPLGLAMAMDPVGKIPHKAVPYASAIEGYRAAGSAWAQVGDGGIQTTPSELVRWADNYRTGSVGGPKLLDAQMSGAVPVAPNIPLRYAAGIYIRGDGTLDHDGAWAGFVTAFRVSKDRNTSVAISCNTDEQIPESMADAIAKLWM